MSQSNLSIIYVGGEEEQKQEQECFEEAACIIEWESRYKKSADNQTLMIRGKMGPRFEECCILYWGDGKKDFL